ncbi:hypothetical protein [Rhizobium leguminosarum]
MLRAEVAAGSQLGASIADDMQLGKLIADETIPLSWRADLRFLTRPPASWSMSILEL